MRLGKRLRRRRVGVCTVDDMPAVRHHVLEVPRKAVVAGPGGSKSDTGDFGFAPVSAACCLHLVCGKRRQSASQRVTYGTTGCQASTFLAAIFQLAWGTELHASLSILDHKTRLLACCRVKAFCSEQIPDKEVNVACPSTVLFASKRESCVVR